MTAPPVALELRATVGGLEVPHGIPAAGPAAGVFAVGEVPVPWGRDDLFAHPVPATGLLQLFDASNRWALEQDLVGTPVVLRYAGYLSPLLPAADEPYFRGRVGEGVTLRRQTVTWGGRKFEGTLITLPLRSILVDLANIIPTAAWPEETLEARRARIAAACIRYLPGGIFVEVAGTTTAGLLAAVPATEQVSMLEHIAGLYAAYGSHTYTYDPARQRIDHVPRRLLTTVAGRAQQVGALTRDESAAPQRIGAYAFPGSAMIGGSAFIDAGQLSYDPARNMTAPPRITRVQVEAPTGTTELPLPAADEVETGVRVQTVSTTMTTAAAVTAAATALRDMAAGEGAQWILDPLSWAEDRSGPLEDAEAARLLLCGYESTALVFLQRSWLPTYGLPPLFGIRGGTITYRAGSWDVQVILAPVAVTGVQHPIAWDEIDAGPGDYELRWYDGDHPSGLHGSLSYEDIGYVATGLGVVLPGPDRGWDFFA